MEPWQWEGSAAEGDLGGSGGGGVGGLLGFHTCETGGERQGDDEEDYKSEGGQTHDWNSLAPVGFLREEARGTLARIWGLRVGGRLGSVARASQLDTRGAAVVTAAFWQRPAVPLGAHPSMRR